MSEERRYPVDKFTGLPHVVLTRRAARQVPWNGRTTHHHLHFPRRGKELEGQMELLGEGGVLANIDELSLEKLGGLAVRVSRVERLEDMFHDGVHRRFKLGPENPHTVSGKFATTVKNCGGIVPRWAIDVTAPEARELVYMNDDTFAAVTDPWRLHTEKWYHDRPAGYQQQVLGHFFMRYAARQDLGHAKDMFNEFLYTTDETRRYKLGRYLLGEGIKVALEPLQELYREAAGQGMVAGPPNRTLAQAVWDQTPRTAVEAAIPVLARNLELRPAA